MTEKKTADQFRTDGLSAANVALLAQAMSKSGEKSPEAAKSESTTAPPKK